MENNTQQMPKGGVWIKAVIRHPSGPLPVFVTYGNGWFMEAVEIAEIKRILDRGYDDLEWLDQTTDPLTELRAERDAFEKLAEAAFDFVMENCPDIYNTMIGTLSVEFSGGHITRLERMAAERDVYRLLLDELKRGLVHHETAKISKDGGYMTRVNAALDQYPSPKQQDNG